VPQEPLVSTLVNKTQIELRANFLELVILPFPELDLEPGSKHKVSVELETKPKIYEKKLELMDSPSFGLNFFPFE
jgi:hypothetical protein